MNSNDSWIGMAEPTRDQFIYSEKFSTNDRTEIEIERVNIRPRKLYFIGLLNLGQSNPIKSKTKERFVLTF
jgi:hypothetical protein